MHSDGAIACVSDRRQGAYVEISSAHLAHDAYNHPFGYRGLRTVDYADSRLAT